MKTVKKLLLGCLTIVGLTCFTACNDNDKNSTTGTSGMKVSMTDAPGDYDEVNIEVIDVKIKNSNDSGENGWVSVGNLTPGIYNLLDLTGGVTVMLADSDVPSGHLGQIRLILGDDNTVVKNGVTYELNTPSAQQSGLKLQVNQTLEADTDYNFLIDFDVEQSIVEAGNSGNFNLHPVLRVTTEAASGSIRGTIALPAGIPVTASVNIGSEVVTANTNEEGVFVLHGIPAGSYVVTLNADPSLELPEFVIDNVIVINGETTDVGSISL